MKQCVVVVFAASVLLLTGCRTAPRVAKWEYKVAAAPRPKAIAGAVASPEEWQESEQALLNELGKDGWVLVSQNNGVFYFKRPIK
jgi:hypothetical protein